MSVDIDKAIKTVDRFISEVDALLNKSSREGEDKERELDAAIQNFVRIAFSDGEKKLEDYRWALHFVGVLGESEEERQDDYVSRLKGMRNQLVAYREELQLRWESRSKSSKLDKIEGETELKEAEAGRRAAVVKTKLWGAVIELLDMQREELKKRGELTQEVIELRKEVRDLKSMITRLSKIIENGSR